MKKYINAFSLGMMGLFGIMSMGCKKFLEIPPPQNELTSSNVFTSSSSAIAAQSGIYFQMWLNSNHLLNLYPSFSSDEMINYSSTADLVTLGDNSLTADNSETYSIWSNAYNCIYQANAVIAGLNNASVIFDSVRNQLIGEAEFVRAYWNFYLVNLFGEVPLVLTTDYPSNSKITRSSVASIYAQIISDLQDAKNKLNANFLSSDCLTIDETDRLRPTKWAASALLARVHLYNQDWIDAKSESTLVIQNSLFKLSPNLNDVFLINSTDAIWQIGSSAGNTNEASDFIISSQVGQGAPGALSDWLMSAFENNDLRRVYWIDSIVNNGNTYYYPYKYKNNVSSPVTENEMILRISEQYLIRAEAEAEMNDTVSAIDDLNAIRSRAGVSPLVLSSKPVTLLAIDHERQVELFTEGHRWLDLRRTGRIDSVMRSVTLGKPGGSAWVTTQQLYPIPTSEILLDHNLTQNSGY